MTENTINREVRKEIYLNSIEKYKEYLEIKGLNLDKDIDEVLRTSLRSHFERLNYNINLLKFNYFTQKKYICTVFKVTRGKTAANYAYLYSAANFDKLSNTNFIREGGFFYDEFDNFLYSEFNNKFEDKLDNSLKGGADEKFIKNANISHEFLAFGPTFKSQDGEYRDRFTIFKRFQEIIEKFNYYDLIEKYILSLIEAEKINLTFETFYLDARKENKEFQNNIENNRFAIKLYVICWLVDNFRIKNKLLENHINPEYNYILSAEIQNELLDEINSKFNFRDIFIGLTTYFYDRRSVSRKIKNPSVGQKMIPLTVSEAREFYNIKYKTWKEIYISDKVSNLVTNGISNSFPILLNHFIVNNSSVNMFDNESQFDKFKYSRLGEEINEKLRQAAKFAKQQTPKSKQPRKIFQAIKYGEDNILLSDLVLVFLVEKVGRTVKDLPLLLNDNLEDESKIESAKFKFFTLQPIRYFLFEIIYGLLSMNCRSYVIHSDIHVNNICVRSQFVHSRMPQTGYDDPMYTVFYLHLDKNENKNTNENYFVIPFDDFTPTFIDFSRAICADFDTIKQEFNETFAVQFFKEQRKYIIKLLMRFYPTFVEKNREKLLSIMLDNFLLVFKAITLVDVIISVGAIHSFYKTNPDLTNPKYLNKVASKNFKFDKVEFDKIVDYMKSVKESAEEIMFSLLNKIVKKEITDHEQFEWPMITLIEKFYSDFKVNASDLSKYSTDSAFKLNKQLKYNLSNYSKFPEFMRYEIVVDARKKHNVELDPDTDWLFENLAKMKPQMDIKNIPEEYIELIEKYKRDEELEESSWMYE